MPARPIVIASAQSYISSDIRENGREIRGLVEQARAGGASIVHFPEASLSGYTKSQIRDWSRVDWTALDEKQQALAALARDLGIWVVVGCVHRLTPPHRPHNSLYVISASGELLTRYDKRFCSHTEISHWFSPGDGSRVFEIDGWRFGCALGIEIQFPEVFLDYGEVGVDCLLFSSYSEDPMFGVLAQGYAAANNYWLSFSVPAQTAHAVSSRLIGPDGNIQAAAPSSGSALTINSMDPADPQWEIALNRARPWRAKARDGEIYREWRVQDPRSDSLDLF